MDVIKIVQAGMEPQITLQSEQEIKPLTYSSPGRPVELLPEERGFRHYAGFMFGRSRPRCKRRGCRKFLKRDQPLACSDECKREMIEEARWVLALLEGRKFRMAKIG